MVGYLTWLIHKPQGTQGCALRTFSRRARRGCYWSGSTIVNPDIRLLCQNRK